MTTPHSTSLYVPRGRGILYIAPWSGTTPPTYPTAFSAGSLGDFLDVGNATSFEMEPVTEFDPHYSSRSGVNLKDLNPVTTQEYNVNFTLDELAAQNLKKFLMGTYSASTGRIAGLQNAGQEWAIIFVSNNPIGPNSVAYLWKVTITPNGALALIGDEYLAMTYTGTGLVDTANHASSPYFDYKIITTTTTSTTTSTTTTTTSSTTTTTTTGP